MPRRTSDTARGLYKFIYRAITFFGQLFQAVLLKYNSPISRSITPSRGMVWALPLSLAATDGIRINLSFPLGTKMFQFPKFHFIGTMNSFQDSMR